MFSEEPPCVFLAVLPICFHAVYEIGDADFCASPFALILSDARVYDDVAQD